MLPATMHKPAAQPPPHARRRSISDPFTVLLQPPPNESQQEREGRLRAESEAKKRSDNIDKMLRESERRNRKKKTVKVLLLGQSESGKSTTLKRTSFHVFYSLPPPVSARKRCPGQPKTLLCNLPALV